jgi:hypothetical protein
MSGEIYFMYAEGVCKPHPPPSSDPFRPIELREPVGLIGGSEGNVLSDVIVVQDALNRVTPQQGGPSPKLVVDGECGPLTIAAIKKFQIKQFGWSDARIDPNKKTIKRLAQIRGGLTSIATSKVISMLGEALSLVKAAQTNLLMALPMVDQKASPGNFSFIGREERMRHANRHFDVDKSPDPRGTLRTLLTVYDTMLSIFNSWRGDPTGETVFRPDPRGHTVRAYAWGAGWYRNGEIDEKYGMPKNYVYIGEKLEYDSLEACAFCIVHELAHFVGSSYNFGDISDNGRSYGWYDNPCIQRLTPHQKVRNAENYSNFAFDLKYGRPPVLLL